ncbi:MAG: hypothetical protein ACTHYM_05525 [Actinomycetaceae bacterium]
MTVGLLVAAALLVLTTPPRRVRRLARRSGTGQAARPWWRRRPRARELDAGLLVSEVAMRLRAGSEPTRAWAASLRRSGLHAGGGEEGAPLDPTGVPTTLLELARRLGGGSPLPRRDSDPPGVRLGNRAHRASTRGALAGVVVACRVTHATGAPLAEILDRSAGGIAESARAAGARTVALAGPRATGRLLGWLPLLGLVLGAAVGADPVDVLLDGGIGSACLGLGLVLLGAGWWWVLREERRAETVDA